MFRHDSDYTIDGINLVDVAKEFGTPTYVYNAEKIKFQCQKLKNSFSGIDVKIKYACKALTNISILKLIHQQGLDIDCVSLQEVHLAFKAGFAPNQVQFTPSCPEFSEIEEAVNLGLKINLDSLPLLEKFGDVFGNSYPVALRINPYVADGGNIKISTAHKDSKFGISCELIEDIVAIVEKYNIKINGLHQHTGSDLKSASSIFKAGEMLMDFAIKYFPNLEFIDFGGGFKVAYKEGDFTTDIEAFGAEASKLFADFCQRYGRQIQLWFEPGKYIVSEAGVLLTTATVVKASPHKNFIGVNSGLNHLIRPMMYDSYHEIVNISKLNSSETAIYDVVGNVCETDTFGANREMPVAEEGDIIAFLNGGAYAFTMASQYNSRFRPAEVLIINQEAKLIRERETMEDIFKNQILVDF